MNGWKLVPLEPTEVMERNAWTDADCRGEPLSCKRIYKAMLANAPYPKEPAPPSELVKAAEDVINWYKSMHTFPGRFSLAIERLSIELDKVRS